MKYFIFSDAHGNYPALRRDLKLAGYDPTNKAHTLVSLGDNFGRADTGEGSFGIWKFLTSSEHINKPICVRGNHESILLNILEREEIRYIDFCNGEHYTLYSFLRGIEPEKEIDPLIPMQDIALVASCGIKEWIKSLPWYFEGKTFVGTHGWIPEGKYTLKDLENMSEEEWYEASWSVTPQRVKDRHSMGYPPFEKRLIVGHWHACDFWKKCGIEDYYVPYVDREQNFIALDGCTVVSKKVNVYVVEE